MSESLQHLRHPAVAGVFYPGDARTLRNDVDAMLSEVKPSVARPRALIVPHAGYVYSGPVAASAYATLAKLQPKPKRVVLLGPAHTVGFQGLALPDCEAMETPLGAVEVDRAGAQTAARFPLVRSSALVHEREHSLEVQLPFLQRVLGRFTVVPLAVGQATPAEVAEVIEALWTEETLVVVSSDLSHYLPYDAAREIDGLTAKQICALDHEHLEGEQACGANALRGLLRVVRERGMRAQLLDLRNSGDTAGDRRRVVGYGAFAFAEEERS